MESRSASKSGSFKSIHEPQPQSPKDNRSEPSSLEDDEFVCVDTERTSIFDDITSPASDVTSSLSGSPHLSPSPLPMSHVQHYFRPMSPSAGVGAQNQLSPNSAAPSALSIQIRAITPSQQLEVMPGDDSNPAESAEAAVKPPVSHVAQSMVSSSLVPPPSDLRHRPASDFMPNLAPNRHRLSVVEIKQNQEAAKKSSIFSCCDCLKGFSFFRSSKSKVEDNTSSSDLEMPATLEYGFPVSQPTTPDAEAGRGRVHQI